jgi:DNA-damage-inducible protein J
MNAYVKAKVPPDLKAASEAIFRQMGLDMSGAIKMFLSQVVMQHGLPFEVKVVQPNAVTLKAIADSYSGNDVETAESVDALFQSMER